MRYDLAALERLIVPDGSPDGHQSGVKYLASRLGVSRESIYRWWMAGLPAIHADRLAFVADYHPFDIWPSWFADALDERRCHWCGDMARERADACSDRMCARQLAEERRELAARSCRWLCRVDSYRSIDWVPVVVGMPPLEQAA